jgi:hypothetical protein
MEVSKNVYGEFEEARFARSERPCENIFCIPEIEKTIWPKYLKRCFK